MSPGQTTPPEGPTSSTPSVSSKGLSKGATIGVSLGVVIAVTFVGIIFFLIGRSRRKSDVEKKTTTAPVAKPVVGAAPATQPNPPPKQEHGEDLRPKSLVPPAGSARPLSPVNPYFYPHASMYGSPVHPHYNPHMFGYGSPPRPLSLHYNPHAAMYGSPPPPLGPVNPHYNPHGEMYGGPPHPFGSTHPHYNLHAPMSGSPPPPPPPERVRENESQQSKVEPSTAGVGNGAPLNKPPDNP